LKVLIERQPKNPLPVRPESPASVPDLSIHLRCYSEPTEARFASNADCGHENYATPATALLLRARASRLGRHGIAEFLVRSEGGRIYCDINELPKFVKP
jgi:hypothetical protein